MAEKILKKLKKDILVNSAGISGNPDYRIFGALEEVFNEENIDFSNHTSKPLTEDLLRNAEVVLVMTQEHRNFIKQNFPQYFKKVHLLTEFAGEQGDIPDPIGGPKELYVKTFKRIENLVKKIIPKLDDK